MKLVAEVAIVTSEEMARRGEGLGGAGRIARREVPHWRGRGYAFVATITSVDLTTAVTFMPFLSFILVADSRVITETSSMSPMSITISAITLPSFTDLILP